MKVRCDKQNSNKKGKQTMQKKRIVIVDGDGTVFRSVRRSIAVFCRLIALRGVKVTPRFWHEAALQWGTKLDGLREEFFPHITEDELMGVYKEMRPLVAIVPFPGMRETFALMKECGIDCYILSSRTHVHVRRLLGENGLREFFSRVLCLEDVGYTNAKPSPHGIEMVLDPLEKQLGVSRDEAVFVGDSLFADCLCAANAGVEFVAVHEEDVIPRRVWVEHGVPEENVLSSMRDVPAWLGVVSGSRLRL
jgi:phosphoglycolate phosphatase-like HAD superfamily hydrolase